MHDKMKLDYNNLTRLIMDAVSEKQNDEETQNTAFAIAIGLELLSSCLKDIATLAIKRNRLDFDYYIKDSLRAEMEANR